MNTVTAQRSAAPLVFTNTPRWPLLAPAAGYRAVHHGPLPQAGIQGGKCLQGASDQTESIHSYQSTSMTVCAVFFRRANNYGQLIHTVCIWGKKWSNFWPIIREYSKCALLYFIFNIKHHINICLVLWMSIKYVSNLQSQFRSSHFCNSDYQRKTGAKDWGH